MSYSRGPRLRALGTAAWITEAEEGAAHQAALTEYSDLNAAIANLAPQWSALPMTPYPPASDTTTFPQTGDTALLVRPANVSSAQLAEPAKEAAGLAAQALARRPAITPLFWIGLACLGVGLYVAQR